MIEHVQLPPAAIAFLWWNFAFSLLVLAPLWWIFRRAGLRPWPALAVFLPLVGFPLALSLLGFPSWPALPPRAVNPRRRRKIRAAP